MSEYREKNIRGEVVQLRRIADTLDTIVAMIKEDQERSKKYMEDAAAHERQAKGE